MSKLSVKERVLITGGSGFVGSWLERTILESIPHAEVVATSLLGGGGKIPLDVTKKSDVEAIIQRLRPSSVVHLAAFSSLAEAALDPQRSYEVNLFGTLHVAQAVRKYVPHARLIFVSSSEVYGRTFNSQRGPLDECALLEPVNTYAATKAAADLLIGQVAADGLLAVRFRPFNHTGPEQSDRFVIPSFARQIVAAERGEQPPVIKVGNLESVRDFLDVRDVVQAYISAIKCDPPLPPGTILNLASGVPQRIETLLASLLSIAKIELQIQPDPLRLRQSDIPVAVGNSNLAQNMLGWSPQIPIQKTLQDVLDHARKLPSQNFDAQI